MDYETAISILASEYKMAIAMKDAFWSDFIIRDKHRVVQSMVHEVANNFGKSYKGVFEDVRTAANN